MFKKNDCFPLFPFLRHLRFPIMRHLRVLSAFTVSHRLAKTHSDGEVQEGKSGNGDLGNGKYPPPPLPALPPPPQHTDLENKVRDLIPDDTCPLVRSAESRLESYTVYLLANRRYPDVSAFSRTTKRIGNQMRSARSNLHSLSFLRHTQ